MPPQLHRLAHVSEAPVGRSQREFLRVPDIAPREGREELFVVEYLRDFNAKQAAIRAGYDGTVGAKLMKRDNIRRAIEIARAERHARVGASVERTMEMIGSVIYGDARELFNEDGTLKRPGEMSEDAMRQIAGVKTRRVLELDENGKPRPVEMQEIKFVNREKFADMAMRHHGGYAPEKLLIEHSVADDMMKAMRRTGRTEEPTIVDAIEAQFEEVTPETEERDRLAAMLEDE